MKHIDLSVLVPEIVEKLNKSRSTRKPSIQLSIPSRISRFRWKDESLEVMIHQFLTYAMSLSAARSFVGVEVREKAAMKGLEMFFAFSPFQWMHCSIFFQTPSRFETPAKAILDNLEYRCAEWIGNENSDGQLGAFFRDSDQRPELLLYLMHRKTSVQCDLLIPITTRVESSLSHYRNDIVLENTKVTDVST